MLFRQKKRLSLGGRIRLCLWPRRSFSRSARYFGKRLLRIPASPHLIALGLAIGVFFAATPLYGLHILCAMFFAWVFSANIAAAALGTVLSNPFTIPFIFSAAYETGRLVLPIGEKGVAMPALVRQMHSLNFSGLAPALFQISVGSLLLGAVLALIAYFAAFRMTARFQAERRKRLKARAGAVKRRGAALCAAFSASAQLAAAGSPREGASRDCLL